MSSGLRRAGTLWVYMKDSDFPAGFLASGRHIGIKSDPEIFDFGVIHSQTPCVAAGIFTRNNFPGHPVVLGREHLKDGRLNTIIVNSGNSNVATGESGMNILKEYCEIAAQNLGIECTNILPSSTGVIGRPLPVENLKNACAEIKAGLTKADFESFAKAIMTTDVTPKLRVQKLNSGIKLLGVAKGAGMIQPDMATMLAYLITDAGIQRRDLERLLRCIANRTFNRLSIDSDTSTSDTLVALANGLSGVSIHFTEQQSLAYDALVNPLDMSQNELKANLPDIDEHSLEFLYTLGSICLALTRLLAIDGEGASKLIELRVERARDRKQALAIGRSLINSPLFKTAIRGADPNWGRIIMAIGKVFDEPVPLENLKIFMGENEFSIGVLTATQLEKLSNYLKNTEVVIRVSLGSGNAAETLWGCDLTEEYVKINAYYTT